MRDRGRGRRRKRGRPCPNTLSLCYYCPMSYVPCREGSQKVIERASAIKPQLCSSSNATLGFKKFFFRYFSTFKESFRHFEQWHESYLNLGLAAAAKKGKEGCGKGRGRKRMRKKEERKKPSKSNEITRHVFWGERVCGQRAVGIQRPGLITAPLTF